MDLPGASGGKKQIKAGDAVYDLKMNDAGFSASLHRASADLKALGGAIATVGAKLTALGGLITAPMIAAANSFKDTGIKALELSKKLEVPISTISALDFAAQRFGKSLGELGGDKSAWQKLIDTQGAEAFTGAMNRARDLGLLMSKESAEAADEYRGALVELWAVVKAGTNEVGAALAPVLTQAAKKMTEVALRVNEWIRANKQLIVQAFQIAKTMALAGTAITAGIAIAGVGAVLGIAATGFTVVVAAVTALLTPVGLAAAALIGLAGYFIYTRGVASGAAAGIMAAFATMRAPTHRSSPRASPTPWSAGDLQLAAKILWATLKLEWQRGVDALGGIWDTLKAKFFDFAAAVVPPVINAFASMAEGASSAFASVQAGLADVEAGFQRAVQKMQTAWTGFMLRFAA